MKERVISAIVMILVLVPLFIAGGKVFGLLVGILSLLGLKELLDSRGKNKKLPSGIELCAMVVMLFLVFFESHPNVTNNSILAMMSLIFLIPTLKNYEGCEYQTKDAFWLMASILFLGTAFHSVINIRNQNIWLLLYLLLVPIITDTFAYLVGRKIGKRKIVPAISPNKSLEGFIGGALFGTVIPTVFYYFMISQNAVLLTLGVTFLLSVAGQCGDLFFSKIKRENKIKDFSNLIPGHGGVLDRFDSLIFVILTYILFIG